MLGNILLGYSPEKQPVFAKNIKAEGAMTALLKDAINPNIVQTLEGTPVLIHGGPFANIAHGTNSVIATHAALEYSDFVVTESGFGSDLGAVKYFDIVVRTGKIPPPDACVLVATVRSLKYHGGVERKELDRENISAMEKGFENLKKHIENMQIFGIPFVVAVNKFTADTPAELKRLLEMCREEGVRVAVSDVFSRGSEGGIELAEEMIKALNEDKHDFKPLYSNDLPIIEKIEMVAKKAFGAGSVAMEGKIRRRIQKLEEHGFKDLPVCIAKTQYSLSSDDHALGRPKDFVLIVTDAAVSAGAGFVVVYCGDIMTMPGLPKIPAAEKIDINDQGEIIGLS
jgi:formate--tetrahydrofolate ligase